MRLGFKSRLRLGEIWGGMGRNGEIRGDTGRCGGPGEELRAEAHAAVELRVALLHLGRVRVRVRVRVKVRVRVRVRVRVG